MILGSGDDGLIMARRLTLEDAEVLAGVWSKTHTPSVPYPQYRPVSGDYEIPCTSLLNHPSLGRERLEAWPSLAVDEKLNPIPGTETITCDAPQSVVGLMPIGEKWPAFRVAL